jgi:ABC-2 type transport system ATP-binding protein
MDAILKAAGLVKSYGSVRAVDGVDLDVYPKEIYGLLGPNGSGKTTTLSMLAGILPADSGVVQLDGVPVSQPAARLSLGYVPQEIALYPQMTAAENLRFFGRMQGVRGQTLRDRVDEALEIVDLQAHANRRVDQFSSGMKRRANIAAALVHSPQVLIMDEPTAGVDPQSRNAILDEVKALADAGNAVVFASHYMDEVERLCSRVGIIDAGRILVTGTVSELIGDADSAPRIVLAAAAADEQTLRSLVLRLPGQSGFSRVGGEFHIQASEPTQLLAQLLPQAGAAGVCVDAIRLVRPNLEDVFLQLTGKGLRE